MLKVNQERDWGGIATQISATIKKYSLDKIIYISEDILDISYRYIYIVAIRFIIEFISTAFPFVPGGVSFI